jgi:hypothetical protein
VLPKQTPIAILAQLLAIITGIAGLARAGLQ